MLSDCLYHDYHYQQAKEQSSIQLTIGEIFGEKDNEVWRNEIINALNVATRRMTYCPDVQDALKYLYKITQTSTHPAPTTVY